MLHAENARFFNCFYCFWSLGDNDFNILRDIYVRKACPTKHDSW